MRQALYLRDGVHLAAVRGDLVTLDTVTGDYGCFPGFGAAIECRRADGRVEVADTRVAGEFLEAGLLGTTPRVEAVLAPPPLATRSVWRARRAPVARPDRRRMAGAYLRAAPAVWRLPFGKLLAHANRERPRDLDTSAEALARDAQVFDQMMPFVPFQGECLFRSRLLLAFLHAGKRDAQWVFGVRTYPFGAHCWLQSGDTVLDDAAERLWGYVPILAV